MYLSKGNFFYALYPSYPLDISLKQKEIFEATDEFGEDVFRDQTFLLHRNILLPGFIYRLFVENEPTEEIKFDYPVEAKYHRQQDTLFIFPLEVKFQEPVLQIYITEETTEKSVKKVPQRIFSYPLKRTGEKIKLPQEIFTQLNKKNIQIVLQQSDGNWVLEKGFFEENKKNICSGYLQQQESLQMFAYLSVKNILDAENGFERLAEDIDKRVFPSTQPKKLGRLLEILRAANYDQEEKIFTSIFLDDKTFFEQIQKELFHDDLIAYMDRKELSRILFDTDDEIIKTLVKSQSMVEKYRPFISRNRFKKIFSSVYSNELAESPLNNSFSQELRKKETTQEVFKQTLLWQHIQKYFENKKKRLFFLKGEKHKFFLYNDEKNIYGDKAIKKLQMREDKYLNTGSDLFVYSYQAGRLIIEITQAFNLMCICVEQGKNNFMIFYFRQVHRGMLFVHGLNRLPQRVVMGATDYSENLYETLAVYKNTEK